MALLPIHAKCDLAGLLKLLYQAIPSLMVAALLAGCAGSSGGILSTTSDASGNGVSPGQVAAEKNSFRKIRTVTPNQNAYKLGPNDVLKVTVFQVEDLDREVIVTDSGKINLPLIGSIQAAGASLQEVEKTIVLRLRRYLQAPQVTVFVKEYNSQKFTVDGAVKRPGIFPINSQITLLQAIATAKGLSKMADPSGVIMYRQVRGQKYAAKFDLSAIRLGKMPDPPIIKNDVIYVDESGSKKFFEQTRQWLGPAAAIIRLGVGF